MINKYLYWTPRILSIIFLLFLAMFSLDIFDGNYGFWGTIVGLFMHNIPVLVLLIVLIIAWKHEIVGTIFYALGGLLYIGLIMYNFLAFGFKAYMIFWIVQISGPAFVIAALFYAGWRQKKKIKA